jgi:hypothetical protein
MSAFIQASQTPTIEKVRCHYFGDKVMKVSRKWLPDGKHK